MEADLFGIRNKLILTFSAGKHFAYAVDGCIKIGCMSLTVAEWLKKFKGLGKRFNYSKEEIKMYSSFIKMVNRRINPNWLFKLLNKIYRKG